LTLSPDIVRSIPPRPFAYSPHRELFASRTGLVFDALAPVEAAAQHVFQLLLDGERASRMIQQHGMDPSLPGWEDVLQAATGATFKAPAPKGFAADVQRTTDAVYLTHLLALAANERASSQVRERTTQHVRELKDWLASALKRVTDANQKAHLSYSLATIDRFFDDPEPFKRPAQVTIPPGQPIGCGEEMF
jgi:hypothetical protein